MELKPDLVASEKKLIYAESDAGSDGLLGTGVLGSVNLNYLVTKYPNLDARVSNNENRRLMYLSVVIGDGILLGDGVVIGDGGVIGDSIWAMSRYAMVYGDPGPSMRP